MSRLHASIKAGVLVAMTFALASPPFALGQSSPYANQKILPPSKPEKPASKLAANGSAKKAMQKGRGKQAASNAKRKKLAVLLTPHQIRRLKPRDTKKYYKSLHGLLVALDANSGGKSKLRKGRSRNASIPFIEALIAEASAAVEEGRSCIFGGYFSNWVRVNDVLSCPAPPASSLWDSTDQTFYCEGTTKAYCSATFYLHGEDDKRFCVDIRKEENGVVKGMTENCRDAFKARFDSKPELLAEELRKFTAQFEKEGLGAYYAETDARLQGMIDDDDIGVSDAAVATTMKEHLNFLLEKKKEIESSPTPPETTDGATDQADATDDDAATTSGDGTRPDRPVTPYMPSVLARNNLRCIAEGLQAKGHNPSETYIALLGIGVQSTRGPFDLKDPERRKVFQSKVIQMVQSYGYCDESTYPKLTSSHDMQTVRNLLTANNGNFRMDGKKGIDYVQSVLGMNIGPARERFSDLFGLRSKLTFFERAGITGKNNWFLDPVDNAIDEVFSTGDVPGWEAKKIHKRQADFLAWQGPSSNLKYDKTKFENCHSSIKERSQKDPAFNLSALNASLSDETAAKKVEVSDASRELCKAMTDACGLDDPTICNAPGLLNNPGSPAPAPSTEPAETQAAQ